VVRRLRLRPGDHVLDVGCGTGANLPHLVAAVGASGHVTGIDLSESMAAHARTRVAENRWDNVDIVASDAATAPLPTDVDSALFFLVHDLVRSRAVVDRIVGACSPDARVVADVALREAVQLPQQRLAGSLEISVEIRLRRLGHARQVLIIRPPPPGYDPSDRSSAEGPAELEGARWLVCASASSWRRSTRRVRTRRCCCTTT
jgi:precorrin-6B methylase 2